MEGKARSVQPTYPNSISIRIPFLKMGHKIYRMISAVITFVRPNVPLTLSSTTDLRSFVRCLGYFPEQKRRTNKLPHVIPSMREAFIL